MKWHLLKSNKCPKCTSYLTGEENSAQLKCSAPACDFRISTEKFSALSTEIAPKYARRDKFDDIGGWNRFEN
jgi:hypothetical protein